MPVRIGGAREVVLPCPALRSAISPVDVAAELISAMKQSASKALAPLGGRFAAADGDVRSAVVTVPAYFDASQRAATETACHLAGLDDVFLLREPEAAALAYGLGRGGDERVLIFDLGGGTFDVSIVDVGGGECQCCLRHHHHRHHHHPHHRHHHHLLHHHRRHRGDRDER